MKILFDPQTFNEQKFGGISRYYTEMIHYLGKKNDVEVIFPLYYSDNLHLSEYKINKNFLYSLFELPFFPKFLKKKILKKSKRKNIRQTRKKLIENDFDVFVPTYYNTYFLDYIGKKPFVLTVYDMIHEIFPQYFTGDLFTVSNKKELIEKATKIIAISESTKNDILKIYPHVDKSKIEVVYLSHSIKKESVTNLSLPENYILFVGNRSIYKNFVFFLKSISTTLKQNPNLYLVCAGGNKFDNEELKLIRELQLSSQIIQQNFDDHELATYYMKAKCFVFPSEYEGFGIPVLESMACGCPVVLANHSSFPEVAGDAGCYFELNNEADLRMKIEQLLINDELRNQLIEKGYQQVSKFNWAKTADDCLEVYKKALL